MRRARAVEPARHATIAPCDCAALIRSVRPAFGGDGRYDKEVAEIRKAELNGKIRTHCEKDQLLSFVDLSTILLGPDGKPARGIWDKDDLHVNQAGYDRLTKLLAPLLATK